MNIPRCRLGISPGLPKDTDSAESEAGKDTVHSPQHSSLSTFLDNIHVVRVDQVGDGPAV